jgi:hypothetical protein
MGKASEEAQEKLRRCMKALDFLADYPMLEADSGDPLLEVGEYRLLLYPFVTLSMCPQCEEAETYFVDAWNTSKETVRLKSFEKGHTIDTQEVSDALVAWIDAGD